MSQNLSPLVLAERSVPRYTSYPTAPHFTPAVEADVAAHWLADLDPGASLSLYLHVPYCRAICTYCGCHTKAARRDQPLDDYTATLLAEIDTLARGTRARRVTHIHWGGGTPSLLGPERLLALVERLALRFDLSAVSEHAIELDPRTVDAALAAALARAGVNRASLGVQSFDPKVQRAINREQSFEQTERASAGLRRAGVSGINFDLIYGLPHQTVDSCRDTVARCIELRPDRFSVFGYAHVPAFKKHQRKIKEDWLPDSLERHEQSTAIAESLREAGYVQIGLDHFALPEDSMARALQAGTLRRNFQGYTTDQSSVLLGFGASAIGRLPQGFVQNEVVISAYSQAVAQGRLATARGYQLTDDDRLRAEIIERIMCDFAVDLAPICARHGSLADAMLQSAPRLKDLVSDGIVELEGSSLAVPRDSRFLVRSVAAAFDAHLDRSQRLHSRAV